MRIARANSIETTALGFLLHELILHRTLVVPSAGFNCIQEWKATRKRIRQQYLSGFRILGLQTWIQDTPPLPAQVLVAPYLRWHGGAEQYEWTAWDYSTAITRGSTSETLLWVFWWWELDFLQTDHSTTHGDDDEKKDARNHKICAGQLQLPVHTQRQSMRRNLEACVTQCPNHPSTGEPPGYRPGVPRGPNATKSRKWRPKT